jgi:hypothetical protein
LQRTAILSTNKTTNNSVSDAETIRFYFVRESVFQKETTMDGNSTLYLTTLKVEATTCLYRTKTLIMTNTFDMIYFLVDVPFMLIIGPIGIAGNMLSFAVIGKEKPFTSTSVLLRALALADGLALAVKLLMTTVSKMYDYFGVFIMYREFQEMSYPYLDSLQWFSKTASIYIAVCVSAERYVAVCWPLRAASICTKRNAYIATVSVFVCSFIYRIPIIFLTVVIYLFDPCSGTTRPWFIYSDLSVNPIYNIGYLTFLHILINSFIPIIVLVFFTRAMLNALHKSKTETMAQTSARRDEETRAVTQRVLAVIVVFIALETPGAVSQIPAILVDQTPLGKLLSRFSKDIINIMLPVSYFLGFVNCFINFFIYCVAGRRFRRTLKGLIIIKSCNRPGTDP